MLKHYKIIMKRILIWGTGHYYQKRAKELEQSYIVAFIDNNTAKQGMLMNGKPIISSSAIANYEYDLILIMVEVGTRPIIEAQLRNMGIEDSKFTYGIQGYGKWLDNKVISIRYDNKNFEERKSMVSISIVAHDLEYNGASLALVFLVRALLNCNYNVYVFSYVGGPMGEKMVKEGATVIVSSDLSNSNQVFFKIVAHSKALFVNTFGYYDSVSKWSKIGVPVYWWIHEPAFMLERFVPEVNRYSADNLYIVSVSEMAKHTFINLCGRVDYILPFGVVDDGIAKKRNKDKIVFSVVGELYKQKAQSIFIEAAISILTKYGDRNIEFWIIGKDDGVYAEELKKCTKDITQIKWKGEIKNEELMKLYDEIDINVCPSLEETMSMATIEAMMKKRAVIVTDKTGISDYIENGKNGIICKAGDVVSLSEAMERFVQCPDEIERVAENARQTYEDVFSIESFENILTDILLENG